MSRALRRTVRAYARVVLALMSIAFVMLIALVVVAIFAGPQLFGVR